MTTEQVESAFRRLAEIGRDSTHKPMARASLVKIRSVLGKSISYAERRGLVSRNIANAVEIPAAARRPEQGRALTVEQAKIFLNEIQGERLEAMFLVMLMLGLRPGEVSGLSWSAVDLERGVLSVRQSLKLHHGELVVTEKLKTSKSRRSLDMPDVVIEALVGHRRRQIREQLSIGPAWSNADDLVFTNSIGGPVDPANLRRRFAVITERAGLGHWHPHELRHSTASLLSAAGVPLEEVADVLGHDGTRMTALVYRHSITPSVKASRRMGDILGSPES